MASEDHQPPHETTRTSPPRNLRQIGIIAVIAAIAIAAFGIWQRHSHEAEVTQWTQEQAVPTVALLDAAHRRHDAETVAAGHRPGLVRGSDLRPRQRLFEAVVFRLRRSCEEGRSACRNRGARSRRASSPRRRPSSIRPRRWSKSGKPNDNSPNRPTNAGANRRRASFRCRNRNPSRPTTTAPSPGSTPPQRKSRPIRAKSTASRRSKSFKRITAPFDGVVTARETDIGALINAGSGTGGGNGPELFRVADLHKMRIYVQVPQQLSADIHAGLSAELHLPQYPDKTFTATVATTSSAINISARTLLVELHAENPDAQLQPGAYAACRLRAAEQSRRRAYSHQRADVPRARAGSRDRRSRRQDRAQADHARPQPRHRSRSREGADGVRPAW